MYAAHYCLNGQAEAWYSKLTGKGSVDTVIQGVIDTHCKVRSHECPSTHSRITFAAARVYEEEETQGQEASQEKCQRQELDTEQYQVLETESFNV
jgi:hypothetical protein